MLDNVKKNNKIGKECFMEKIINILLYLSLFILFSTCLSYKESKNDVLYLAIIDNNLDEVKKSLKSGADINKSHKGFPPIIHATLNGNLEIVDFLLMNGAKPVGALYAAIIDNHFDIAEYLIESNWVNMHISPSMLLEFRRNSNNISNNVWGNIISFFELRGIDIYNEIDNLGSSVLHLAVKKRNLELVKYLLEINFDVNILDKNGHTALFYAVILTILNIDWEFPVLEDEISAKLNFKNYHPFHPFASFGDGIFCDLLVKAGINVNQQNKYGWTVLHFITATYESPNISLYLILNEIIKYVDMDLETNFGRTATEVGYFLQNN